MAPFFNSFEGIGLRFRWREPSVNRKTMNGFQNMNAEILKKAVGYVTYLVARREYSVKDVREKLIAKFDDAELVEYVLAYCVDKGYVSDERFASSFAKAKAAHGNGPEKIRFELSAKGISKDVADEAMAELEIDFLESAISVLRSKFSRGDLNDYKTKCKAMRALLSRGFNSGTASSAVETLAGEAEDSE